MIICINPFYFFDKIIQVFSVIQIMRLCWVPAQRRVFFWGPIAAGPSSRQWPHYWHEG